MRNRSRYLVLPVAVVGLLVSPFLPAQVIPANARDENRNPRVLVEDWKPLFNGKTLAGWRTYQNKPADSWGVKDGMLFNKGNADPQTKHADLITEKQYEDFELSFDWKFGDIGKPAAEWARGKMKIACNPGDPFPV